MHVQLLKQAAGWHIVLLADDHEGQEFSGALNLFLDRFLPLY